MINTVLGEIESEALGSVLCHEHVACFSHNMKQCLGDKWFNTEAVIERAVKLFKQAKEECGVDTIIDGTPFDLGRDIDMMREVSKQSGVNIIASSGMYYSEEPFLSGKSPEAFAQYFIDECKNGINGTDIKPCFLKCATSDRGITPTNKMLLEAMSIVQRETGLPMFAHNTHHIKSAYEQIKLFEENGVNLKQVVIGHCSDSHDINYLEDLLNKGCYLGFDRIYSNAYHEQAKTMYELIERGWEDKLLVSHDYFAFIDFGNYTWESIQEADRDFTVVHKKLLPKLKKLGATDEQIFKITNTNPKKLLTGE